MANALVVQGLTFPAKRRRRPQAELVLVGDQPEAEFMREVLRYLRVRGWGAGPEPPYHTHDSTGSPKGFPDIVAIRDGHGLALECKSQHGRVPPEQANWILAFSTIPGFIAAVIRPSDWPWILKVAQ